MSHPNPDRDPRPSGADTGATRVTDGTRRRGWLLPLILGLIALLALLALLSRCGNDDGTPGAVTTPTGAPSAAVSSTTADATTSATGSPTDTGTTDPAATSSASADTPTASGSGAGGAGAAAGTVVTQDTPVLGDGPVKDLNSYTGKEAVGRGVQVQSVPADEGFWVGSSATDRLWVQLTGKAGESPYQVKVGDLVDFTGTITPAPAGFAAKTGLTAAEGAGQLTGQKQYISVNKSTLKRSA